MGRRVIAIDGGPEKKKLCESLGADAWIDFTECKDIVAEIKRITDGKGAHAAVVTTASSTGYTQAVDYLREGGKLMAVGLPANAKLEASIFFTVFKVSLLRCCSEMWSDPFYLLQSLKIIGSYVGNREDAVEAIRIAAAGKVKVFYKCEPLAELEK